MYVSRDVLPNLRPIWHVRFAIAVVLVLVGTLLMSAGIASAAKPSAMSVLVEDAAFGDVVAATVSGSTLAAKASQESTEKLWVFGRCYQGDAWVYGQYSLVSGGSASLQLGPTPSWRSGAADCVAELGYFAKNGKWRGMDTTSFSVAG